MYPYDPSVEMDRALDAQDAALLSELDQDFDIWWEDRIQQHQQLEQSPACPQCGQPMEITPLKTTIVVTCVNPACTNRWKPGRVA